MAGITADSDIGEVAAIVSSALHEAGIVATLSGGGAVCIYTDNQYRSNDLDFVTAAMVDELAPVLQDPGFVQTGIARLSQFDHPLVEWYLEFLPSPLTFGHLSVDPEDCAELDFPGGRLRIITPTQSVMDRLAAAIAWNDPQSRDQAFLVAARHVLDWPMLESWFDGEGQSNDEFKRFRAAVESRR